MVLELNRLYQHIWKYRVKNAAEERVEIEIREAG